MCRSRQAAQELLFARNHVKSGGDKIVESLEVTSQTKNRGFDFGHRSAKRGAL